MNNFTERQLWDIVRHCVGNNNTFLRKIFSSSVASRYNYLKNKYPQDSYYYEKQKNYAISAGMRNIYKAFSDKFFEYDYEGSQDIISLASHKIVWMDCVSTKDLYYYYCLQKKVIDRVKNFDDISEESIIREIENSNNERMFSGTVDFISQKPPKEKHDRGVKIDLDNHQIQQEALITIAIGEYEKYCKKFGMDFEGTKREFLQSQRLKSIVFDGYVAKTYFQERENMQKQEESHVENTRPRLEECSPEESRAIDEALKRRMERNILEATSLQDVTEERTNNNQTNTAQTVFKQPEPAEQLTIFDFLNKSNEQ